MKLALRSLSLVTVALFAGEVRAADNQPAPAAAPAIESILPSLLEDQSPMSAHGVFAGQMAENQIARTLILLNADQKQAFGIDKGVIAFANYRHAGHFYVAHLSGLHVDAATGAPMSAQPMIESVHVIQEHWEAKDKPDIAAEESHAYLQFFFTAGAGVQLDYDQTAQQVVTGQATIDSSVMSIEAIRPESNPTADFMPYAFRFDFAIGHLFYDKADRDKEELADNKINDDDTLSFINTSSNVAGIQRSQEALLFKSIETSDRLGRSQTYNVVLNNCTNRLFDVVDMSIHYSEGFGRKVFDRSIAQSLKTNLPQMTSFVESLAPQILDNIVGQIPDLDFFESKEDTLVIKEIVKRANKSQHPSQFNTWFPPFVHAHLAARHLLPSKAQAPKAAKAQTAAK